MRKSMISIGLVAALTALGAPGPASAQEGSTRAGPHRRPPLRIEITPTRKVQRQCADWYVIEHRASGDTVVPRSHCWWVAR